MRALCTLLLLLLGGCQQSFDDRYSETEQQLNDEARQMEKDMAAEAAPAKSAEN